MAFFFVNSSLARVVALLPEPGRRHRVAAAARRLGRRGRRPTPAGRRWQPDVEALLVRAERGGGGPECYLVPIDACYELVGRLRPPWRGFDGGAEAWRALDAFFDRVRERAMPASVVTSPGAAA